MHKTKRPPAGGPLMAEDVWQSQRQPRGYTAPQKEALPRKPDGEPVRITGAEHLTQALAGEWLGNKGIAPCPACGCLLTIRRGNESTIYLCCPGGCSDQDIHEAIRFLG